MHTKAKRIKKQKYNENEQTFDVDLHFSPNVVVDFSHKLRLVALFYAFYRQSTTADRVLFDYVSAIADLQIYRLKSYRTKNVLK